VHSNVTQNSSPSSDARPEPPGNGYPARQPTADPNRFLIPREELPAGFAEKLAAPVASPVPPRPAATVVLVRDAEAGPETLLLRRHNRSGFAADAWVFPGGIVDESDMDPALPVLCDGPVPDEWAEALGLADPLEAFGYAAAAVREAFEETGILLARPQVTQETPAKAAVPHEDQQRYRDELLAGRLNLRQVAAKAGIQFSLDQLTYIAHWITPEPEPRRYDTRFFLAPVPPAAEHMIHEPEMVEARWLSAPAAVEGFREGSLKMLPPTVHTLRRLAEFRSVAEMRTTLAGEPVRSILPRMRRHPDGFAIEVPTG
jgi:8-oxo-dGTP pyrophosphatase MutT (NUDIX family)